MNCLECEEYDKEKHYCPKFCSVIRGAMDDLREYFVPVIRCKDCKYRESWLGIDFVCKKFNLVGVEEDDYCSMAERKEE